MTLTDSVRLSPLTDISSPWPDRDCECSQDYDALRRIGVNRVSFCFEIWDPKRFIEVCPGKHREYGLKRYLDAVEYCARIPTSLLDAPWVANGEIVAGLEDPQSSIRAIDWVTGVGAIPTVCVFRPLNGTDFEDVLPPKTEDMIPVFRRLYEACMEKRLPIGLAPNIPHVSLVLLPEECRWFSDRPNRYWRGELKRRAMSRLFRWKFEKHLRRFPIRHTPRREPASAA